MFKELLFFVIVETHLQDFQTESLQVFSVVTGSQTESIPTQYTTLVYLIHDAVCVLCSIGRDPKYRMTAFETCAPRTYSYRRLRIICVVYNKCAAYYWRVFELVLDEIAN